MTHSIEPVKVNYRDTELADSIDIWLLSDDLQTQAAFGYGLRKGPDVKEQGSVVINGEAYANWNGSNSFAIDFVVHSLNLTIIPDENG